jgi:creatinine amidohydrolase
MCRPLPLVLACCTLLQFAVVQAQTAPQMRTRYFTSLTNPEVEGYLKRNDVIFIPVGTSESFGTMPNDLEYTMAEAYALKMAEEADGLVLPHVIYFYPGVTVTGVGSVYVPEDLGEAYLKAIAHSLLRQGFRRQIYLSAHGPSDQFVSGMVRQFFEETKDPILYIHIPLLTRAGRGGADSAQGAGGGGGRGGRGAGAGAQGPGQGGRGAISYGSYHIVGRLGDLPLNLDVEAPAQAPLPRPPDSVRAVLGPLAPESSAVGSYDPDPEHNGGRPLQSVHITAELREQMGRQGAAMIEATVKALDIRKVIQALRDEDKYVHDVILPRFKDILPKDRLQ